MEACGDDFGYDDGNQHANMHQVCSIASPFIFVSSFAYTYYSRQCD
jgi:hypothetical protein